MQMLQVMQVLQVLQLMQMLQTCNCLDPHAMVYNTFRRKLPYPCCWDAAPVMTWLELSAGERALTVQFDPTR